MLKLITLATALSCIAMAQTPKPDPTPAMKDSVAAYIEQVRSFAEQAVKDPTIIESTAKANRAKVVAGNGSTVYGTPAMKDKTLATNHIAEELYQIQEDLSLDAAVRAAKLLAHLPTLTKEAKELR